MPCGRRGNPDSVATRPAAAPVASATETRRGSIRPTRIVSSGFICCSSRSSPRPSAHCWVTNATRSEEHTSELQSPCNLVCRLLLEKKKKNMKKDVHFENQEVR